MTLTDFLLARIAEDEARANAAQATFSFGPGTPPKWESKRQWEAMPFPISDFIRTASPARMLAECEAKRRIVDALGWCTHREGWRVRDCDGCSVLALLALPYADHPDYRDEWRP